MILQWEAQQELLKLRKASPGEREKYFEKVEERRVKATQEQVDKWAWQKKQYGKIQWKVICILDLIMACLH